MAIDYSGSGQYHLTGTTPVTAVPLTLACWFNSDSITASQVLIQVTDSSSNNNYFGLYASGNTAGDPVRALTQSAAAFGPAATTTGYAASTWYHAAGVFSASDSRSAYIDGGSKGTETTAVTPSSIDRIGLAADGDLSPGSLFNGRLAEAAIWNVALDDAEVAALAAGYCPLCVHPSALVFYAPLVQNVMDVRGGLTLTATGSPTVADHCRIIYPYPKAVLGFPRYILRDLMGGLAVNAVSAPTIADHCRIVGPQRRSSRKLPAPAGAPATAKPPTGGAHALRGQKGTRRIIFG